MNEFVAAPQEITNALTTNTIFEMGPLVKMPLRSRVVSRRTPGRRVRYAASPARPTLILSSLLVLQSLVYSESYSPDVIVPSNNVDDVTAISADITKDNTFRGDSSFEAAVSASYLLFPLNYETRRELTQNNSYFDPCASYVECDDCVAASSTCHFCSFDNKCHTIGSVYGCLYGIDCDHPPLPSNTTDHNETSCASHKTCPSCTSSSSTCHWCDFDNACHAIGSVYGCLHGNDDCHAPPPPTPSPSYSPESTACASHKNCTECALSSYSCHWCAFDNACHAVGSVYGCASGVDCFSNERCRRTRPEFRGSLMVPAGVFFLVFFICAGCVTCLVLLFSCVRSGKGAYDDLKGILIRTERLAGIYREEEEEVTFYAGGGGDYGDVRVAHPGVEMSSLYRTEDDGEEYDEKYGLLLENDHLDVTSPLTVSPRRRGPPMSMFTSFRIPRPPMVPAKPTSQNVNSLFRLCKIAYGLALTTVLIFFILTLLYYPRLPQYNFCSDEYDWKSIVDAMISMKLSASFQLLLSVYNPNRFDINVDQATGTFTHSGVNLGTFEVPAAVIKARSVSDYLVTTNFESDKWEALRLTSDYYMGTLTLWANVKIHVSFPMLGGYSLTTGFDNYLIRANDTLGRELCACPSWNDVKK